MSIGARGASLLRRTGDAAGGAGDEDAPQEDMKEDEEDEEVAEREQQLSADEQARAQGDGDRDGLPNVLMEAQSQGVACISTDVSGIPELILDRETGVLVPPHDPSALARAIETLLADPDARARLGAAGQARVIEKFSHAVGIDVLAAKFGMSCASPSTRR